MDGFLGTDIATLCDRRVPQPGEYAEYGVPEVIVPAIEALYRARTTCGNPEVRVIDEAIIRLLWTWIRNP